MDEKKIDKAQELSNEQLEDVNGGRIVYSARANDVEDNDGHGYDPGMYALVKENDGCHWYPQLNSFDEGDDKSIIV